ncbi:7,8-didemethyl-8-hydroxy-5-deazariboflavin synthase subunit CofG [Methanimicrococcus blatticola]|uniref:7,8-didemethyl-8-hydroxy-5-deazariboflavin synthase n=1 Tax=Methanimicrococcus blatticola TaxID=91560 RepID=A0A484F764_9EURY|nr:7,8-didemethyl-8-hydroxy-5-deazariboflavin synthase subunit CofG [Methanimicrococcus blatticola]MBZ3935599.1 7,8-didemethyl-8-hydroxy-5-deazariboflavin synthase subunit CofG [Methanimicrococcus blatticola]MCC2509240.1 7,8-didemethyl-8-hydroxy-5-deazariboflavin synthase subunit CofG [Methanimicrococcus blatticola]TDQ69394.1 FO synthase subunit 1 [Methanimicrococcus blatticola]
MKNRPITYSKNIFIPVTNVCRNKCAYCGFRRPAEHQDAFLMTEEEAAAVLKRGADAGCTEAMFAFGESPEQNPEFNKRFGKQLKDAGFETVIEYTAHLCRLALDFGLLPHVNGGVLSFEELKMLAPLNASMGLMLETTADVQAHKDCPGKVPAARLEMIENAGKLKMPFTTGLLIGIGETRNDWVESLQVIQKLHEKYGHIQEIILQNYTPNSGQENIIRDLKPPSKEDMIDLIHLTKNILTPDISIQVAPNLMPPLELIQYGVTDLGGISPVTIDFINPESDWPEIEELKNLLSSKGYEFKERLPVHPHYVKKGWYGAETEARIKELADVNGYRKY